MRLRLSQQITLFQVNIKNIAKNYFEMCVCVRMCFVSFFFLRLRCNKQTTYTHIHIHTQNKNKNDFWLQIDPTMNPATCFVTVWIVVSFFCVSIFFCLIFVLFFFCVCYKKNKKNALFFFSVSPSVTPSQTPTIS